MCVARVLLTVVIDSRSSISREALPTSVDRHATLVISRSHNAWNRKCFGSLNTLDFTICWGPHLAGEVIGHELTRRREK